MYLSYEIVTLGFLAGAGAGVSPRGVASRRESPPSLSPPSAPGGRREGEEGPGPDCEVAGAP